jgi:anaerobic magnesium-protoporphyrin IX monomethyl ester cyclase
MARVALVNPPVDGDLQTHREGLGHLGLAYIAACLLRDGHRVIGLDCKTEPLSDQEIGRRLTEFGPSLVGVTAMTHEIHRAVRVCEIAHQAAPGALTMAGGPHATALPERTLLEFPAIDIAVVGEGEETVCEIARRMESGSTALLGIQGIAFREDGKVVRNPNRPWIGNPDELPLPAWRLFPKAISWGMFAGRGCPYGCKFCQRVLGRKVRMRSVDNVMAEIDALDSQLGAHDSWFQDETFALNRRWTEEFLTKLEERNRRTGYVWRWKANSRANLADESLYRRMKEAGCLAVGFGIESGNPEILKRIGKSITKDMALRAIQSARRAGLETAAFFIIGHPGETVWTALETVRFAGRLGADDIAVGVMVPYPGTEIWEMARAGQYNYRLLTEDWRMYDKYFGNALEIKGLSHKKLEALQVATYLWFYLRQGRFRQLFSFLTKFRREAMAMLRRLLQPAHNVRTAH